MMNCKNGFTLIELLIAAAIIGTIAIFATQSFRSTTSDIRVEDAKARAKIVAVALRRFMLDNPTVKTVAENERPNANGMPGVTKPNSSNCTESSISLQNLVDCGYLEYRQYAAETRDEEGNLKKNFKMWFNLDPATNNSNGEVCFQKVTAKITDKKIYCTDGEQWEISNS